MAGSRGLNPRAPAYIPLSYTNQTPFTNFPPLPLHIHHFPFSSPPPLPLPLPPQPPSFFPTPSQSPLLHHPQSPLYTTPYPIHPPEPPPPRVVEPPPIVPSVGPETVRIGAPRRRPSTTSGFRSSQHHQKEPNFRASSRRNRKRWRRGSMLKKYEVLPLSHCEEKTTVMIKNIPKLFNGKMLLKFLDEHCLLENQKRKENSEEEEDDTVSAFDFMYLPIDFSTGCSRGFAFVNFTEARAVWKFLRACNRKTWELFQYPKTREIVCARIQGKAALVKHFAKSTFHCESDEFLPVCFSPPRDGSGTDQLVDETRIGKRIAPTTPNA